MATPVLGRRPRRLSGNEVLVSAGLLAVFAVGFTFLAHYALPYFRFDPTYFDYYWPHRFRLITHICGGMLALTCGPFQFWTGLRQRAFSFHRWTGRLYLLGVGVGSAGAFMMAYFSQPRSFGVALGFMALTWLLATAMAYFAIIRGLVSVHKQWMARSYLVTFGFVTFRLLNDYTRVAHWGTFADRAADLTWMCWGVPWLIYEIVLQWPRLARAPRRAAV